MYRIIFKDVKRLQAFLSINDIDYVDMLFEGNTLTFVSNTNEAYAEYSIPVQRSANQGDLECRIFKKILQHLSNNDYFDLTDDNGVISLSLFNASNNARVYSCRFPKQIVATSYYVEKRELIRGAKNLTSFDSDNLMSLNRIAKTCGGLISIDGGVASVILKEGPRVYKKVNTNLSYSVHCKTIDCLRKCNHVYSCIQNYLLACNDTFYVLAKQARLCRNEEYNLLTSNQYGAKYIADIDLTQVLRFLSTTKLTVESLDVDVVAQVCKLNAMHADIEIPVPLTNERVAPNADVGTVYLPIKILTSILGFLDSTKFTIKLTKHFTEVICDNYVIAW